MAVVSSRARPASCSSHNRHASLPDLANPSTGQHLHALMLIERLRKEPNPPAPNSPRGSPNTSQPSSPRAPLPPGAVSRVPSTSYKQGYSGHASPYSSPNGTPTPGSPRLQHSSTLDSSSHLPCAPQMMRPVPGWQVEHPGSCSPGGGGSSSGRSRLARQSSLGESALHEQHDMQMMMHEMGHHQQRQHQHQHQQLYGPQQQHPPPPAVPRQLSGSTRLRRASSNAESEEAEWAQSQQSFQEAKDAPDLPGVYQDCASPRRQAVAPQGPDCASPRRQAVVPPSPRQGVGRRLPPLSVTSATEDDGTSMEASSWGYGPPMSPGLLPSPSRPLRHPKQGALSRTPSNLARSSPRSNSGPIPPWGARQPAPPLYPSSASVPVREETCNPQSPDALSPLTQRRMQRARSDQEYASPRGCHVAVSCDSPRQMAPPAQASASLRCSAVPSAAPCAPGPMPSPRMGPREPMPCESPKRLAPCASSNFDRRPASTYDSDADHLQPLTRAPRQCGDRYSAAELAAPPTPNRVVRRASQSWDSMAGMDDSPSRRGRGWANEESPRASKGSSGAAKGTVRVYQDVDDKTAAAVSKALGSFGLPKISAGVGQAHKKLIVCAEQRNILEEFNMGRVIGKGQFGVIRLVEQKWSQRQYACKTISKASLKNKSDIDDVRKEHAIVKKLQAHPHVCRIEDTFEDDDEIHFIMEFCEGGDLFDRIKHRKRYSEADAATVMRTVLGVLEQCHSRGIVHRDIKPENILLCSKESDTDVKVIDFGIATQMKPGAKPLSGLMGSLAYMAPEVIKGIYGCQADTWSAGVLLFVLLHGAPPFWSDSEAGIMRAIKEDKVRFSRSKPVSEGAQDLILRLMTRDPAKRITPSEALEHPWIQDAAHWERA